MAAAAVTAATTRARRMFALYVAPAARARVMACFPLQSAALVDPVNKRRIATDQISELTTNRLSVYLRCLNELEGIAVQTISSQALAEQFHLNAAQIRKDLAYFGEFGVRGVGYYVRDLRRHLRQILGLDRKLRVAIMGAGNLGLALADYPGFRAEGFEIAALFDAADEKIGQSSRGGVPIHDIADLKRTVRRDRLDIAIIAVPGPAAQSVVDQVVAAGMKAILNFSPGTLKAPPDVKLKSVDFTVSLESLSFYLAQDGPGQ
jgi:redox-sensing transcriptional repressor